MADWMSRSQSMSDDIQQPPQAADVTSNSVLSDLQQHNMTAAGFVQQANWVFTAGGAPVLQHQVPTSFHTTCACPLVAGAAHELWLRGLHRLL